MDEYFVQVLSNMGVISFIALSAYLILVTGEISFGQQSYFAISAYASGIATAMWNWNFISGMMFGILCAGVVSFFVAWPTLRLRGLYFSIASLALGELTRLLFENFHYQIEIDG